MATREASLRESVHALIYREYPDQHRDSAAEFIHAQQVTDAILAVLAQRREEGVGSLRAQIGDLTGERNEARQEAIYWQGVAEERADRIARALADHPSVEARVLDAIREVCAEDHNLWPCPTVEILTGAAE